MQKCQEAAVRSLINYPYHGYLARHLGPLPTNMCMCGNICSSIKVKVSPFPFPAVWYGWWGMSYSEKKSRWIFSVFQWPKSFGSGGDPVKFGTVAMKEKVAACRLLWAIQADANAFKSQSHAAWVSQSQELEFTSELGIRKSNALFLLFFQLSLLPHHFSLHRTICLSLWRNALCMLGTDTGNGTPHSPMRQVGSIYLWGRFASQSDHLGDWF